MSISAIGGCGAAQAQSTQYRATQGADSTTAGAVQDGGSFISAIAGALSDIGVTSAAASGTGTDSNGTSADPAKALGDFLQTLMEALHSQGGGPPAAPPEGTKGDGAGSDLQSLIDSLGASTTDSGNSAASGLTASFKNLLGALGVDDADAGSKLGQFLQTLSARLESSGPAGNLINTTA